MYCGPPLLDMEILFRISMNRNRKQGTGHEGQQVIQLGQTVCIWEKRLQGLVGTDLWSYLLP